MNIAMDYSWYAKDKEWQKDYSKRIQNFLFCRGIDTFEDQYNIDGILPEWILPAGGYKKLRHSLGLASTSAAASIMAHRQKSGNLSTLFGMPNSNPMRMDILIHIMMVFCTYSA